MTLIAVVSLLAGTAPAGTASAAGAIPSTGTASMDATFTYPRAGQTGVDATKLFTWSSVSSAEGYAVAVGTARFGTDLAQSAELSPAQTSYPVAALPVGQKLHATLLTKHNGVWGYRDLTFTAARADMFTFPANGQVNVDMTKPFTWSTIPASQGAILTIGSTAFGTNYGNSGLLPPGQTSLKVPSFLAGTLYATLLTKTNGGYTRYQTISFTAAPAAAAMVTVVNSYFAAVNLKLNGQSLDLAPSQQVGPVAVIPASSGNDIIELNVIGNACGLGDAQHYFDPGTSYRLSVFAGVGKCVDGSFAPNFTVVPT